MKHILHISGVVEVTFSANWESLTVTCPFPPEAKSYKKPNLNMIENWNTKTMIIHTASLEADEVGENPSFERRSALVTETSSKTRNSLAELAFDSFSNILTVKCFWSGVKASKPICKIRF